MGYIRKALAKGFSEMYGLKVGSGTIYFFRKVAATIDSLDFFCLFWSGSRHTALHPYPHYRVHFFWGGRGTPPPYFWEEKFKIFCFGEVWDSGRAVRGQNFDVPVDRISPGVVKK